MIPADIQIRDACFEAPGHNGRSVRMGPISLDIRAGEFLALLGPARSGKTAIIKLVAGLIRAYSGEVLVAGARADSIQCNLGIVFDTPALMPWRTIIENVLIQSEVRGLDRKNAADRARHLLVMLGLEGHENRKPHHLTAAQQVRAAIARALAPDPVALLMDNPFRGLNPMEREQIASDFQRLSLSPQTTILFATSMIGEAVQLSDRVAVLSPDGGSPQSVSIELARPRRLDKETSPRITEYCATIRKILQAQGILD